jgi:hypothetical protein
MLNIAIKWVLVVVIVALQIIPGYAQTQPEYVSPNQGQTANYTPIKKAKSNLLFMPQFGITISEVSNGLYDYRLVNLTNGQTINTGTSKPIVGLSASLSILIPISEGVFFAPQIGLSVKGEAIRFTNGFTSKASNGATVVLERTQYAMHSAHLVLPYRFETSGKNIRLNLAFGPYIDFTPLTRVRYSGTVNGAQQVDEEWNPEYGIHNDAFRLLNLGLHGGAGLQYKILDGWFCVQYNYERSLTSPLKLSANSIFRSARVYGNTFTIGAIYPISSL